MAIPQRPIRGMRDIRTFSGRGEQEQTPHKIYMRLYCLELEKFRRTKEKELVLQRVNSIEMRFQQIKSEKADLVRGLRKQRPNHPVTVPPMTPGSVRCHSAARIRLQY